MAKKIYLSPSNQYGNTYSYGNTNEMEQCNRIADYAKTALVRCGFSVKKAPKKQNMNTSINESNSWGADLHIPIHTNAYNGKVTGGTLVMLYSNNSTNNKAGKAILDAVAPISPGGDYSLRYNPGLAELNATSAIAVYVEVEFHDTAEGAKWIINNAEKVGEAIAKGVCSYYGVKYVSKSSATSSTPSTTTTTTTTPKTFETAGVQALLRQAYAQDIVQTYVKPIDNLKGKLTNAAILEAKAYLGYKNPDNKVSLEFIAELEAAVDKKIKALENIAVGDVNGDGVINIKDVTALQKEIAGIK